MTQRTETIRFEEVKHQARKSVPCPMCGKKVRRTRTFSQTISPFNRNLTPDMTYGEAVKAILAALKPQAEEWQQKSETCTPCLRRPLGEPR